MNTVLLRKRLEEHNLNLNYQFDRQARPHVIITIDNEEKHVIGVVRKGRRNPLANLPPEKSAAILAAVRTDVRELIKWASADGQHFHIEVHFGQWQSSRHIHLHAVLPLQTYTDLMHRVRFEGVAAFLAARPGYVAMAQREHTKYIGMDRVEAERELESQSTAPHDLPHVPLADGALISPNSDTAEVQLCKTNNETDLVAAAICARLHMGIEDAYLIVRNAHDPDVVNMWCSYVVKPAQFLDFLPRNIATRRQWLTRWTALDDPIVAVTHEDFSIPDAHDV